MHDKHYLEYYDDAESVSCVPQAKEEYFTPREFAESGYLPMFVYREAELFRDCLEAQQEAFIYDIFCRVYALFQETCPFTREQFSLEQYTYGEETVLTVIELPKTDLQEWNFLKYVLIFDSKNPELYFLAVCQRADAQYIHSLNLYTGEWEVEDIAPTDTEEMLGLMLALTVEKYPNHIPGRCPLCGTTCKLGLTDEELEGYQKVQSGEADPEDAIPGLNAFEREFLLTGMCPDCQCRTFRKELPEDLSRWKAI